MAIASSGADLSSDLKSMFVDLVVFGRILLVPPWTRSPLGKSLSYKIYPTFEYVVAFLVVPAGFRVAFVVPLLVDFVVALRVVPFLVVVVAFTVVTFLVVAWRTNLRWGFSSSSFNLSHLWSVAHELLI